MFMCWCLLVLVGLVIAQVVSLELSLPDNSVVSPTFAFRVHVDEDHVETPNVICVEVSFEDNSTVIPHSSLLNSCHELQMASMELVLPRFALAPPEEATLRMVVAVKVGVSGAVLTSVSRLVSMVSSNDGFQYLRDHLLVPHEPSRTETQTQAAAAVIVGLPTKRTRDFMLALGIQDVYMVASQEQLPLCSEAWGFQVTCCPYDSETLAACLPLVADVALMSSSIPTDDSVEHALDAVLKRVRGHVVLLGKGITSGPPNDTAVHPPTPLECVTGINRSTCAAFDVSVLPTMYTNMSVDICAWNMDPLLGAIANPKGSHVLLQSAADFRFRYGMHTASLSNVCLLDRTTFLLINHRSDAILDEVLRGHLEHTYAGFVGLDDATGFTFQEVSGAEANDIATSRGGVLWSPGTSIFASATVPGNIFHAAQSIMGLVHSAYHLAVFPWVARARRLVATSLQRGDLAWSLGLHKAALAVVHEEVQATAHSAGTELPVHGYEDVERAVLEAPGLVCFEEAAIVGSTELSAPFLGSKDEAQRFRRTLYRHLQLSSGSERVGKGEDDEDDEDDEDKVPRVVPVPVWTTAGRVTDLTALREYGGKRSRSDIGPNHGVRVTILTRSRQQKRSFLNLPAMVQRLKGLGVVDSAWLDAHVLSFDGLSFAAQVRLMHATDVFIAAHGSGLQNLMFLQEHSSVVEIFTSPWYEPGYQPTALLMGIHYYVLPQTSISNAQNCDVSAECLDSPLMVQRRSLACLEVRRCDVSVDVDALEVVFWLAAQATRLTKRDLLHWRYESREKCCPVRADARLVTDRVKGEEAKDANACGDACFYEKGYSTWEQYMMRSHT